MAGSCKVATCMLAIFVIFLARSANAVEPKEYEPSSGGGDCDTDLDCSNEGRCVNEDDKASDVAPTGEDDGINGKCLCNDGRDGKNCEKADKKTKREIIFGTKRRSKRELAFDSQLKATGLDPKELADKGQVFLIYNPRTLRYVRVSTDAKKGSNYIIGDTDYRGGAKLFKLKSTTDGKYNIIAMDDDGQEVAGYLFVSSIMKGIRKKSNRVMKSKAASDGAEYQFSFVKHPLQNGVYKLKCNGKTLYTSVGHHNVKADDRSDREKSEEIWFQFNLKASSDITTKLDKTKKDVLSEDDNLVVYNQEYDNDNSADLPVNLDKEQIKSKVLTEFEKYAISGTGGLKAAFGNIGFTVSKEGSTTKQYTISDTGKSQMQLTVKAKTKVCLEFSVRKKARYDEDKLDIEVKGKKFVGYKIREVEGLGDVSMKIEELAVKTPCK